MRLGSGVETATVSAVPDSIVPVKTNITLSPSRKSMPVLTSEQDKKFEEQVNVSPGSTSSSTTKNVVVVRPVYRNEV